MGPLKIISDGSLNTRTAWCCAPYADPQRLEHPSGQPNLSAAELRDLMSRAHGSALEVATHAIGDAAVAEALAAYAVTGARGSIEHAQLVGRDDVRRMAELDIHASVQPAHLLDDRDLTDRIWGERSARCFAFRWMLDDGVTLALGSDAPVSPLDPWLAMAAAVHRSADEREAWHPGAVADGARSAGCVRGRATHGAARLARRPGAARRRPAGRKYGRRDRRRVARHATRGSDGRRRRRRPLDSLIEACPANYHCRPPV